MGSAWEIILITWQSNSLQSTSVQGVWETDPISSHAFICLTVLICALYFSVCVPQVVEKTRVVLPVLVIHVSTSSFSLYQNPFLHLSLWTGWIKKQQDSEIAIPKNLFSGSLTRAPGHAYVLTSSVLFPLQLQVLLHVLSACFIHQAPALSCHTLSPAASELLPHTIFPAAHVGPLQHLGFHLLWKVFTPCCVIVLTHCCINSHRQTTAGSVKEGC